MIPKIYIPNFRNKLVLKLLMPNFRNRMANQGVSYYRFSKHHQKSPNFGRFMPGRNSGRPGMVDAYNILFIFMINYGDSHGRRNSLRSGRVRHIAEKQQVWSNYP